ncbi:MAG TPA: alpha/beta fold hydrolase [Candidatus Acidoferrales bacterium]|nr:alpha/beta fold hydrolase [Candidatus Acidoferrales bacterium]
MTAGEGIPLVLCHGFIGSAENFETWVPRLARRRQLVIPDLPGFGSSAPLPSAHTSRALAAEVLVLLDQLELSRYELGGLCLGAAVALELLALAPDRPRRMILHTPLLDPTSVSRSFQLQVRLATTPGVFKVISFLGRRRALADFYRRIAVEGRTEIDRRAADLNFANQVRADPRAAREWLRDGMRANFRPLLDGWKGPVEVMAAADDRLLELDRVEEYCAGRPQTEISVITSAGHGWDAELIRRQLDVLEQFLAGDEPGPGQVANAG